MLVSVPAVQLRFVLDSRVAERLSISRRRRLTAAELLLIPSEGEFLVHTAPKSGDPFRDC